MLASASSFVRSATRRSSSLAICFCSFKARACCNRTLTDSRRRQVPIALSVSGNPRARIRLRRFRFRLRSPSAWTGGKSPASEITVHFRRPSLRVASEPFIESQVDLIRVQCACVKRCGPQYFDGFAMGLNPRPRIEKIEIQCRHKSVVEGCHDFSWLLPVPNRWKREHADQVAHAALKLFNLRGMTFEFHIAPPGWGTLLASASGAKLAEELIRRREKWILLQSAADNDQWMGAHDVDYRIPAELCEDGRCR